MIIGCAAVAPDETKCVLWLDPAAVHSSPQDEASLVGFGHFVESLHKVLTLFRKKFAWFIV